MLTQTQEKILILLLGRQEEQFTIRGASRRLKKSYTLVYNNISNLEKKNIIKKQNIPPAQIIKINEFAPKEVLINIEFKRKIELLQNHSWIKVLLEDILTATKDKFFILLVFGSYAKGTQNPKSDFDLLFIVQDKKDIKEIEDKVYDIYSKIKKSLIFVDINNFRKMINNTNEMNIGNESKKNHIILQGVEEYYKIIQ